MLILPYYLVYYDCWPIFQQLWIMLCIYTCNWCDYLSASYLSLLIQSFIEAIVNLINTIQHSRHFLCWQIRQSRISWNNTISPKHLCAYDMLCLPYTNSVSILTTGHLWNYCNHPLTACNNRSFLRLYWAMRQRRAGRADSVETKIVRFEHP